MGGDGNERIGRTLRFQIDARVSPQAWRGSERKGLRTFTDDGGARAAAMVRRPALQFGGEAARAQEGV
jgi:hypothetical protein